ncbi:hypothetical protein SASPL_129718 [Salvia splendens]|uniref:Photosystem II PsbX n=1 Tax=Salvia splendens TaxID=180675 RepID=A0A8X8XEY8_SALSN|nr:uncharacterized protein LOC121750359 [Salvia splendens]KAG6411634.1 hypothetical protein SASPL_129718 [Salvia splendens]
MASTSALSMALPLPRAGHTNAFLKGTALRPSKPAALVSNPASTLQVKASLQEKAAAGLTAAALTASMVVPDVAEAASSASPSLNNFLLSIAAGGVVLSAILGAVIGVSNFDPVKRG